MGREGFSNRKRLEAWPFSGSKGQGCVLHGSASDPLRLGQPRSARESSPSWRLSGNQSA